MSSTRPSISTVVASGLPLSDPEVSGMLRNLRESIRLQMAGRDHLLVRQCPGFFLYRPLYEEFEFSGGVASETHTFDQIRKYSPEVTGKKKRHIAFIHDAEDVTGFFSKPKDGDDEEFPQPVQQASAALHNAADELVGESVKTRRPNSPDDETVSSALQKPGDADAEAQEIHDQMFPQRKHSSIGTEQPLPLEATKDALTKDDTRGEG